MKRQRLYTPFNEMQQMVLKSKFSCCIWCNREFTLQGFSEENDQRLGRVRRSLEHIIPESLFGRIVSPDVCKACNESFGQSVDPALLRDGSILTAAERAGLKLTELLAHFEGDHHTASGRPVKTKARRGVFHPKPEFHAEGFRIAMTEGKFRTDDLRNAKAKMFVVVKANLTGSLSDYEMREIYSLLRRRRDGKSLGFVHDYMWQAAALVLGTRPLSQAEFEAIMARLERSCRTFEQAPTSRNYIAALKTTLGQGGGY